MMLLLLDPLLNRQRVPKQRRYARGSRLKEVLARLICRRPAATLPRGETREAESRMYLRIP